MSNYSTDELSKILTKKCHIRNGSMNLYRTICADKGKDKTGVINELSLINLQIQLIQEQLSKIENPMCISCESCGRENIFISVGIKETELFDFKKTLQPLILKFMVDKSFDVSFAEISSIREAAVNPARGQSGIVTMLQYCNHISVLTARFADKSGMLDSPFTWYDSFTGVGYSQSSLAFEKGAVIFNIGALATQLVNAQDLRSPDGIKEAEKWCLLASSAFKTVMDTFRRPPSSDMSNSTMSLLVLISLAQAAECRLLYLLESARGSFESLANDCAYVSDKYATCLSAMRSSEEEFFHYCVLTLTTKADYYSAQAHYYYSFYVGGYSGISHLQHSALLVENTLKTVTSNTAKYLVNAFHRKLADFHHVVLDAFSYVEVEDVLLSDIESLDLSEVDGGRFDGCECPCFPVEDYKVDDLFIELGPIHVFNARQLTYKSKQVVFKSEGIRKFGFHIKGSQPIIACHVESNGPAWAGGLRDNDIILSVNDLDVRWVGQQEIITIIKSTRRSEYCKFVVFTSSE